MQEGADAALREVQIKVGRVQRVVKETEVRKDPDKEAINAETVFPKERVIPS